MATTNKPGGEITLERLERCLEFVAYAIIQDGPVYAPIMERLERDIAEMKAREDVTSRAQRYLQKFQDQKAIC